MRPPLPAAARQSCGRRRSAPASAATAAAPLRAPVRMAATLCQLPPAHCRLPCSTPQSHLQLPPPAAPPAGAQPSGSSRESGTGWDPTPPPLPAQLQPQQVHPLLQHEAPAASDTHNLHHLLLTREQLVAAAPVERALQGAAVGRGPRQRCLLSLGGAPSVAALSPDQPASPGPCTQMLAPASACCAACWSESNG